MTEEKKPTRKSRNTANIYQRINEVRKKVNYVRKDAQVQGYKAVTHDAVTAMVRNELIEQGIIIVPSLVTSTLEAVGKTGNGATIVRYAAQYAIRFINADAPNDEFVFLVEAHANDHGDKAPGKALSYATKAAILKVFNIETGVDDEARTEAYEDRGAIITADQASIVSGLIAASDVEADKFLAWCEVSAVEEIPANKYKQVIAVLERKVRAAGEAI